MVNGTMLNGAMLNGTMLNGTMLNGTINYMLIRESHYLFFDYCQTLLCIGHSYMIIETKSFS
jgi:hypothetical protein